jgi:hypothetical protein
MMRSGTTRCPKAVEEDGTRQVQLEVHLSNHVTI